MKDLRKMGLYSEFDVLRKGVCSYIYYIKLKILLDYKYMKDCVSLRKENKLRNLGILRDVF